MTDEAVTVVEAVRHAHRWRLYVGLILLLTLVVLGLVVLVAGGALLWRLNDNSTPVYASAEDHFKYGSIGSEPNRGIPYWIWKVLPVLYPDAFGGRDDYSAFGFLYEADADGVQRDLPIGIAQRKVAGVNVVWLNCATCHTGTWRQSPGEAAHIVPGMPSNNLDFHRFVAFLIGVSTDPKLGPDELLAVIDKAGVHLGPADQLIWRAVVLPRFREGLLQVRSELQPLLDAQPDWGPGRVDTFNPYKVIQFGIPARDLAKEERIGAADLPAIFNQDPRGRMNMNLHWDGNNADLGERNLSAAIGAGVTAETVDHAAIERVAAWLKNLEPPPSPNQPDAAAVTRGQVVYRSMCAACHGRQEATGYVFDGARLGQIEPVGVIGTDRHRLDSYTEALRTLQQTKLFAGTPYNFTHFKKTDGYANLPLDGLWLRGPYLHNGSVPTLADLLKPPGERPKAFVRGLDTIDPVNGGFLAPACTPGQPVPKGFCFDTALDGNGAGGHLYGITLPAAEKADLLAYLLTF